ncbi:MAG: VWA domain-containing protein, partial [Chryseobacterium sp.]
SQSADEPATFPGFEKVWAKVEEKLDKKEEKKKVIPVWFPYGIAASLIIGLGAFYFINKKEVVDISKPQIAQNTVSPKGNNVQEIDRIVKSNIEKEVELKIPEKTQSDLALENVEVIKASSSQKKYNDSVFLMRKGLFTTDEYYIKKRDKIASNANVDLDGVLDKDNEPQEMREVVVTGALGIKKRQDATSSSTQISNSNVVQSLQGRVAGIKISSNNNGWLYNQSYNNNPVNSLQGQIPSSTISGSLSQNILIRGAASLNGNNQPLVVIDGIVANLNSLSKLNPQQIKSVEVLKDASATAIYGNRASNGVIIVKTKKLSRKERKAFKKLQKAQD